MDMRGFGAWLSSNTGKVTLAMLAIGFSLAVIFTVNHPQGASLPPKEVRTPQLDLNPRVTQKAYDLGPALRSGAFEKTITVATPPPLVPYREPEPSHSEEKKAPRPIRLGSLPAEKPLAPPTPATANPLEAGSGKRDWADTAPFGRQLKCKLTNAVESKNLETPVIGLVTEDLKWGNLLIPADTEVHGVTTGERVQDRIGCDTHWVLVLYEPRWHSRRELKLQAIALDRDVAPVANPANRAEFVHFGQTDGSGGLRGDIVVLDIKQQLRNKAELFAAAFLSAFSLSFQNTGQTVYGFQAVPSLKNAALEGTSGVMAEYAEAIRKKIEKDAEYVRVPAGKLFYLYITQTLDVDEAKEGLMLPRDQGANDFGPRAENLFRKLYQRKQDERQQELGPSASAQTGQAQMAELQRELLKLQQQQGPLPAGPPNLSPEPFPQPNPQPVVNGQGTYPN
jgi:hypothetical protein